jgi:hypothetical protein
MSISNATADIQTGREVVLSAQQPSELTGPKYTAVQIENDCPARLQQIAREITEKFEEVRKQAKRINNHVIAINNLITEAQGLCDVGGFDKFRELFCPQLGKSQAYVRLAIANGKTTLVEHRAKERERKQKTRANQKAVVANSGTVPENSDTEPEALAAPADAEPETNIAPEQQTPGLSKARGSVSPGDEALMGFSSVVCRLLQIIKNKKPERYAKTSHDPDDLEMIGQFFIAVGIIRKKSQADRPAALMALPDGTVPVGQPAVGPDNAVVETSADLAA